MAAPLDREIRITIAPDYEPVVLEKPDQPQKIVTPPAWDLVQLSPRDRKLLNELFGTEEEAKTSETAEPDSTESKHSSARPRIFFRNPLRLVMAALANH